MHELSALLESATASVTPLYYYIQIDGGDLVYRERVYCYELYHQLRRLWPGGSEFCLNGELDKSAHPILCKLGANYAKPDLLVHKPGRMDGNHAVIEVKSSKAPNAGITKDLDTLALFRNKVGYQRAIYLIFGSEALRTAERLRSIARKIDRLPEIELWIHCTPGKAASHNPLVLPTARVGS